MSLPDIPEFERLQESLALTAREVERAVTHVGEKAKEWFTNLFASPQLAQQEEKPAECDVASEAGSTSPGRWRAEESARWTQHLSAGTSSSSMPSPPPPPPPPAPEPRAAAGVARHEAQGTSNVDRSVLRLRRSVETARLERLERERAAAAAASSQEGEEGGERMLAADEEGSDGEAERTLDGQRPATADGEALEVEVRALRARLVEAREEADEMRTRERLAWRERERQLHTARAALEEAEEAREAAREAERRAAAASYHRPTEREGDTRLCVVCLDGERTHLLMPCGHRCLCAVCARRYEAHLRLDGAGRRKGEASKGETSAAGCAKKAAAWPMDFAGDEGADTEQELLKPKLSGGGGPAPTSTGAADSSSSTHTCPLCREPVQAVVQVWDD